MGLYLVKIVLNSMTEKTLKVSDTIFFTQHLGIWVLKTKLNVV